MSTALQQQPFSTLQPHHPFLTPSPSPSPPPQDLSPFSLLRTLIFFSSLFLIRLATWANNHLNDSGFSSTFLTHAIVEPKAVVHRRWPPFFSFRFFCSTASLLTDDKTVLPQYFKPSLHTSQILAERRRMEENRSTRHPTPFSTSSRLLPTETPVGCQRLRSGVQQSVYPTMTHLSMHLFVADV